MPTRRCGPPSKSSAKVRRDEKKIKSAECSPMLWLKWEGPTMWFTQFLLISAVLVALTGSCIAADDRKICESTNGSVDRIIEACKRVIAASPGDVAVLARLGPIL